jgi:hypothetical protein
LRDVIEDRHPGGRIRLPDSQPCQASLDRGQGANAPQRLAHPFRPPEHLPILHGKAEAARPTRRPVAEPQIDSTTSLKFPTNTLQRAEQLSGLLWCPCPARGELSEACVQHLFDASVTGRGRIPTSYWCLRAKACRPAIYSIHPRSERWVAMRTRPGACPGWPPLGIYARDQWR